MSEQTEVSDIRIPNIYELLAPNLAILAKQEKPTAEIVSYALRNIERNMSVHLPQEEKEELIGCKTIEDVVKLSLAFRAAHRTKSNKWLTGVSHSFVYGFDRGEPAYSLFENHSNICAAYSVLNKSLETLADSQDTENK